MLARPCDDHLKRLAIQGAAEELSLVRGLVVREQVDQATLAFLFDAPDALIRREAAVAVGTLRSGERLNALLASIRRRWRDIVFASPAADGHFSKILEGDPALCADWLRACLGREGERRAGERLRREGPSRRLVVPRRRLAVSAGYLASHYGSLRCWSFPEPEREAFDQVVLTGTRKADVQFDASTALRLRQWIEGEIEELSRQRYPLYNGRPGTGGDVLFGTRTVDPLAAATEARRSGLWVSPAVTDALWPARDARTRPLMPLRRGHLAMLVAAGFLDNLELEAEGRRIVVKGRTSKEMILVETTPEKEIYRERLRTSIVALDLHGGAITDIAA